MLAYLDLLKLLFKSINKSDDSCLQTFEIDSVLLHTIKEEVLRGIDTKNDYSTVLTIPNPERRSDSLLNLMSQISQISARFLLSTEISNELVLFPQQYQENINCKHETFYTVLNGAIKCSRSEELTIETPCWTTLYIPGNTPVDIKNLGLNTTIWKIFIMKPNLADCLKALATRAMHHHSIMRTGLPFRMLTGKIEYQSALRK